jgi:hypothetical protein
MNELQRALVSNSAATPAENVLEALDDATALRKLEGAPHSIYEEVWHLHFWQDISLRWIAGEELPYPKHAAEGFPTTTEEPWQEVRKRFLTGTRLAAAVAGDDAVLPKLVACGVRAGETEPRWMTAREQLESLAAHNAYHLGRIVLLRQLMGCWPPPSGGDTW